MFYSLKIPFKSYYSLNIKDSISVNFIFNFNDDGKSNKKNLRIFGHSFGFAGFGAIKTPSESLQLAGRVIIKTRIRNINNFHVSHV